MKIILVSCLWLTSIPVIAQQTQAVTATTLTPQALYERGIIAMNQGDVVNAEKDLRGVLRAQPQHPHAKYALRQLLSNRDKIAARHRENMMKQTKIAQIEYSDASVLESLDSLSEVVKQTTQQKFFPNFVVKDPMGKLKSQRITLELSNVPASQVLEYVTSFAKCKVTYEEHAILVEAK